MLNIVHSSRTSVLTRWVSRMSSPLRRHLTWGSGFPLKKFITSVSHSKSGHSLVSFKQTTHSAKPLNFFYTKLLWKQPTSLTNQRKFYFDIGASLGSHCAHMQSTQIDSWLDYVIFCTNRMQCLGRFTQTHSVLCPDAEVVFCSFVKILNSCSEK